MKVVSGASLRYYFVEGMLERERPCCDDVLDVEMAESTRLFVVRGEV
jgi:hypothetical protein